MGKINMLAAANIRKSKSQTVSLLIFVLIAAMFLNIGLVLYFNFTSYFDKRAEELNAPHLTVLQEKSITTDEQLEWMENYQGVTQVEEQTVISGMGEYYSNGSKTNAVLVISNADTKKEMEPLSLIGESLPLEENSIYVPYLMKAAGGYELGDTFRINLSGTEASFTVAGFTEEITFGSMIITSYRFYVSDSKYTMLENEFPENKCYLRSVCMEDNSRAYQMQNDYLQNFFYQDDSDDPSSDYIYCMDYESTIKQSRTLILTITAMVIFAFAMIILAISLIVIRFGIVNNIDESMINIGTLKAAGYKNNQISFSIILQFFCIAIIGSVLGVVASVLVLPMISSVLESQSALIWIPEIDYPKAIISVLSVLTLVVIVSFITTRRIYKLHPLTALRGGLETHNFKKNYIPLETSRGNISLLMAMKQILLNKKQGTMIILIVLFLTFASICGISIYYNVGVDTDSFTKIITGEVPDAAFVLKDNNDTESVSERLCENDDVRKVFGFQYVTMLVEGSNEVDANIIEDFNELEGDMLYEGRYPTHANEVAVGGSVAKATGKEIGDTIKVKHGSKEKEFIITGLIQIVTNNGYTIAMTYDGILTIKDNFQYVQIYVYLTEGKDSKEFIEDIESSEGDIFTNTMVVSDLVDAQFSSYGDIFAAVAAVILVITVIVVVLVLYLVIKTMILRRKRDFGIQKAVGFTTVQLMNQVALNYTPLITIGVVAGGISGYFSVNPLFTALMSSMGVMNAHMPSPTSWTIAACIALIVLAYAVSMLVAWRIRKISPYSLIS